MPENVYIFIFSLKYNILIIVVNITLKFIILTIDDVLFVKLNVYIVNIDENNVKKAIVITLNISFLLIFFTFILL